jgi:hypothetical protein
MKPNRNGNGGLGEMGKICTATDFTGTECRTTHSMNRESGLHLNEVKYMEDWVSG